jgi:hypothetical protein
MSHDSITRRTFALCLGATAIPLAAAPADAPWNGPAVVHKVYLANAKPTWPYPALDVKREAAGIDAHLATLAFKHPGTVRFTGGEVLLTDSNMDAWVKSTSGADAILVMDLTTSTGPQSQTLEKLQTPLLLFQRVRRSCSAPPHAARHAPRAQQQSPRRPAAIRQSRCLRALDASVRYYRGTVFLAGIQSRLRSHQPEESERRGQRIQPGSLAH